MMDVNDVELRAIRSSFSMLVARWRLTQGEVRELLGQHRGHFAEDRILPDVLGHDAETRMRLLLRLEDALERLAPETDLAEQVRVGWYETIVPPLAGLGSLPALRAAVRSAERVGIQGMVTGGIGYPA